MKQASKIKKSGTMLHFNSDLKKENIEKDSTYHFIHGCFVPNVSKEGRYIATCLLEYLQLDSELDTKHVIDGTSTDFFFYLVNIIHYLQDLDCCFEKVSDIE